MGQKKGNPSLTLSVQNQAYSNLYTNNTSQTGTDRRDGGTKPVMIDDVQTLSDVVDVSFATDAVLSSVSSSINTIIGTKLDTSTYTSFSSSIEATINNKKYSFISYEGTSTTSPTSGSYHKPLGTQTGNITYNSSTGLYTLDANKIYLLEASIILSGESDHQSIWRNHTTNTNIGTQTTHVPVNTAVATYSQTIAKAIIVTTTSTEVGLTTLVKTGTPILVTEASYHTIFQI